MQESLSACEDKCDIEPSAGMLESEKLSHTCLELTRQIVRPRYLS